MVSELGQGMLDCADDIAEFLKRGDINAAAENALFWLPLEEHTPTITWHCRLLLRDKRIFAKQEELWSVMRSMISEEDRKRLDVATLRAIGWYVVDLAE